MNKRRLEAASWENELNNFAALSTEILLKFRKLTFVPSRELLTEVKQSFSKAAIEEYDNGKTFSAYRVIYERNGVQQEVIFKTTNNSYPIFHPFDSREEYEKSFSSRG